MFNNVVYITNDYRRGTIIHPLRMMGINLLEMHGETLPPDKFEELLTDLKADGLETDIDTSEIDPVRIVAAEVIDALDLNALDVGKAKFEALFEVLRQYLPEARDTSGD